LILLGSFFLLNLLLAVMMESYMQSELIENQTIIAEKEAEQKELEARIGHLIVETNL